MDGYAVFAKDSLNAPVRLELIGESAAGRGWHRELKRGQTVAIMTGAPVPKGSDAVQKIELTRLISDRSVEILEPTEKGRYIIKKGSEILKGAKIFTSGDLITENMLASIAAFGYAKVKVSKRPHVSIHGTGSEIVEIDKKPGRDQIRNSNSSMLDDLCRKFGASTTILQIAQDEISILRLIFFGSLILIFWEKINRSIVAISGAVLMIGMGKVLGFYNEELAIEAIDFNTLGLLLGMMMFVAMLEPTGFFEYLAVLAARSSKGKPIRLFILLGIITTILSMFSDNVTTVVLIAPVTILINEILGISPLPYLMSEALLSNVGGVATLVGDPPNVLIGSAAGLSFNDFLLYSLPIVLVSWAGALLTLRILFKKDLSKRPRRTKAVMKLNPAETLNHPQTARQILIVLGMAILLFFIHHALHVEPSLIALGAAAVSLLWVQPDLQEVLKRVEWSVLIFFGALFIMVGGLEHSGALRKIMCGNSKPW